MKRDGSSYAEILLWLERFALRIEFQQLPPSRRRRKNRVILQYSVSSGTVETCGGTTLLRAIAWARLRSDSAAMDAQKITREDRPGLP